MKKLSEEFGGFNRMNEAQESHSCSRGGGRQNHQLETPEAKIVYQCPMKCDSDKTYNAPGKCPVCNMHLEPVNEVRQL